MGNCRENLCWMLWKQHIFRTFFSKQQTSGYCRYLAFQMFVTLFGIHLSTSIGTYSELNAHEVNVEQHWVKTIAVQFSWPVHPLRDPWALHANVCVNSPRIPGLYRYWWNSERSALLFSKATHGVKIQCFNQDWINILQDSYWSLNAAGDPTSASEILWHNQYENRCYIFIDTKQAKCVCVWVDVSVQEKEADLWHF